MKSIYNIRIVAFLSLWLIVGLSACGDDNSTGSQEDCNTSLPAEFAPATVDQSYFVSQSEPDPADEQYSTYYQVQTVATSGAAFFATGAGPFGLASNLLIYAQISGNQPDFENGSCVWTISPPPNQVDGQELTVTVFATSTGNGIDWEIIYDGEFGDDEVLEDFRIMTGFTSEDTQSGEWNYYDPENPGSPVLTYTWDIESDTEFELNLSITDPESFGLGGMNYVRSGAENSMTFNDGEEVTEVYWNEDTDSGWIEVPGEERACYTDFVNSACS